MSVEFTSPAAIQNIDFGSPAGVIGLAAKTISFWIKLDSQSVSTGAFSIWGFGANEFIDFFPTSAKKLQFSVGFSGAAGIWTTTNAVLIDGTWHHIVLTYNGSSTSNNPVIYVDGSSVAVTKNQSPTGTVDSGTTVNLYFGHPSSGLAPDGRIADGRIYDTVLSASQVAALYAAGVFTPNFDSNLVFHAPLNNCTELGGSTFDGFTLTSSQLFSDRIGCVQGTPSGSPLGSSTNPS